MCLFQRAPRYTGSAVLRRVPYLTMYLATARSRYKTQWNAILFRSKFFLSFRFCLSLCQATLYYPVGPHCQTILRLCDTLLAYSGCAPLTRSEFAFLDRRFPKVMNLSSLLSLISSWWITSLALLLGLTLNISLSDAAALPEIFYTTVIEPPVYVTITSCTVGTIDVVAGTVTVTQMIAETNTVIATIAATATEVGVVTATANDYVTATYVTTVEPTSTVVVMTVSPVDGMASSFYEATSSPVTATSTYDSESTSSINFSTSSFVEVTTSTTETTETAEPATRADGPSSYSTTGVYFESSYSVSSSANQEAGVTSTYPAEMSSTTNEVFESSSYTSVSSSTTSEPSISSVGWVSESSTTYLAPSFSYSSDASLISSDGAGWSSATTSSSPTITTIPSEYVSSTLTSSQDTTSTTTTLYTTVTVTVTWSWTTISTDFDDATSFSVLATPTSDSTYYTSTIESTTSLSPTIDNPTLSLSTCTTASSIPTSTYITMSLSTTESAATTTTEEATSTAASAISDSSSTPLSTIIPYALSYSPYTNSGNCKTAEEVAEDLAIIAAKGISTIRIYGTDCNSISTVESAAAMYALKVIQGLWIDSSGIDSIDSGVSELISWGSMDTNWDMIAMITVGNEAVQDGYITVSELLAKISSVRTQLRDAGYTGPITTAETPNVFISNPELCTSDLLDLVAINAQPYFDEHSTAETAGEFDLGQIEVTKAACNNKDVFITETGYPSSGLTNYNNIPSVENQKIAVKNILEATNGNVTMFTMYNDLWKALGPYEVEQSFGIIQILA
ncbi:glycoside hydrolase superfamily [Lipomyces chichibuensis]|uniref:glycoside hydrolase superfamily n=1 Tax=Lipomyces chichibuensis TaxID=1546026 RepID=UPI003343F20A